MGRKRSKLKKNIRKLDADEPGVSFDEENPQELFEAHLENDEFLLSDKFDDDETHIQPMDGQLTSKHETEKHNVLEKSIDLHGCTVDDAIFKVDDFVSRQLEKCNLLKLKVITGRGLGSGHSGPVLAKEIHAYIKIHYRKKIIKLESSPADALVGGVAIRGHFEVHLKS